MSAISKETKPIEIDDMQEEMSDDLLATSETSSYRAFLQFMGDSEYALDGSYAGGGDNKITSADDDVNSNNDTIFTFKDISVTVKPRGEKGEKQILNSISHTVKSGSMLAVMGPSGGGKTTLMKILSLQSRIGRASGSITMNGKTFTGKQFKSSCFYLPQYDKNWQHLTCIQVLTFSAKLFNSCSNDELDAKVQRTLEDMGLVDAGHTKCSGLSGGQARRLSLGIALLKNPKILFLDEVTSGLDSAASYQVVSVLSKIVAQHNLIVICTIHQPSSVVFEKFTELLLLSKGSVAYAENIKDAEEHFAELGFPLPEHTNPSEHYMNLVNSDFASSSESRDACVEAWKSNPHSLRTTKGGDDVEALSTKVQVGRMSTAETISTSTPSKSDFAASPGSNTNALATMFHRHLLLTVKDPVLYFGRCAVILVTNCIFAFVYWNARGTSQQQVPYQLWLFMWFMTIPALMGVVAVSCLHGELQLIQGEIKNGMITCCHYIIAKLILTLPIVTIIFGLAALVIPMFVIQDFPFSEFLPVLGQWSLVMYLFESLAECVAAWSPNTSMLAYLTYWILSFLFGGIFLPPDDLFWPLKVFYYALPFNYYIRTMVHTVMSDQEFDPCDPTTNLASPVCVESGEGEDVVKALEKLFPVIANPSTATDMVALFIIIIVFKSLYIAGVYSKAHKKQKMYKS